MSEQEQMVLADYLKVFTNPLRIKIIYLLLDSEKSVTEIVNSLNVKQCTVSMQLKLLMDRNVVTRRAEKKFAMYTLKDPQVVHMLDMVRIGLVGPLN